MRVAQPEVHARAVAHHHHAAVTRIHGGELDSLDLFASGGVHDDERAGATVENESKSAVGGELQAIGVGQSEVERLYHLPAGDIDYRDPAVAPGGCPQLPAIR